MSEPFVGEIRIFAGNFAPRGWAFCEGQLLAVSQNDALFSLLGTTYGGDGRTTFGLPDLRGRVPVHAGTGPGLSMRRLGERGGAEEVAITSAQLPAHTHALRASTTPASLASGPVGSLTGDAGMLPLYAPVATAGALAAMDGAALGDAPGGGQPHANVAPFLCVHFIIALFGIYPSRS